MNSVYHEGEIRIQELMGVRTISDSLSSMIQKDMSVVAIQFLKALSFSVITFSKETTILHSSIVFGFDSFIKILTKNELLIDLTNRSFIPKEILEGKVLNIGFIGLDFENKMRIRINGKGDIKNNQLHLVIDEIYSNCPKYITDRKLKGKLDFSDEIKLYKNSFLEGNSKHILSNTDTFFLSTIHKSKGADISHKGGKKGFLRVISSTKFEFDDFPGNNLYNSIGNIYTNPNINILAIDFFSNDILHIVGTAKIIQEENNKRKLKILIEIEEVSIESNSFTLKYGK